MYRSSSAFDYSYDPITAGLTLTSPFGLALSDTLAYDATGAVFKTNTATLSWGAFSASLVAAQGYYYYPDLGSGWIAASTEESFVFSSFKSSFATAWKSPADAPFTASFSVDASYTQSLLQFSSSVIGLTFNLTFKVTDLIDLSFKSVSQNSAAWRYCPWLFPAVTNTGYTADHFFRNPIVDILDGFAFWIRTCVPRASSSSRASP